MAVLNTDMKPLEVRFYTLGWERKILYTSMQVVNTYCPDYNAHQATCFWTELCMKRIYIFKVVSMKHK